MPYRASMPIILFAFLSVSLFSLSQFSDAASRPSAEVIKEGAKNGGCDYDPYEKLKGLGVVASNAKIGSIGKNEQGLDIAFACRLSKFLEWAKAQPGCNPRIGADSAFRTRAQQEVFYNRGTGAAPGASCHEYGLAVDILNDCPEKMRQAATQFKLASSVRGYPNPKHFQCLEHAGGGGRTSGCRQACDGGIAINPDMGALSNAGNNSPTSALSNMFRQALGLDQQPQQQQQPPPPPTQQQPLQQGQQPSQYFPTSQPTTNTGTSNSGSQSPTSALSPESQKYLGVTQPDAYKPSIADQLLELAYGTPTATTTSTSSIPLVIDPKDNASLTPASPSETNTSPQPHGTSIGTLQPSQTFTSQDLSYTPHVQQTYTPPQTGVFAVLENLKTILLRMLEILRPMGIRNALQGNAHVDEHAE